MLKTNHRFFVSGDVAVIEVYSKKVERYFYALVDSKDLEFLKSKVEKFYVSVDIYTNYIHCKIKKTKGTTIGLHRLLLNTPKGLVGDHINHNGLDNRRSNIRNVTYGINNSFNRRLIPEFNPIYQVKKEVERKKWEKLGLFFTNSEEEHHEPAK